MKKNERPLKRELDNESLDAILNHGCSAKKQRTFADDDYFEHVLWKSDDCAMLLWRFDGWAATDSGLSDIQRQMSAIVQENPDVLEALILQPQVEQLIQDPSAIAKMFAADPVMNEAFTVRIMMMIYDGWGFMMGFGWWMMLYDGIWMMN